MEIQELLLYPIKSLPAISLPSATLCAQGLRYDRRYILLKPLAEPDRHGRMLIPMFVGNAPEMALFCPSLSSPSSSSFTVSYRILEPPIAPLTAAQKTSIEIPFQPDVNILEKMTFDIHLNPAYQAYVMPTAMNTWFSDCFGYEVKLVYLGDVTGVKKSDEKAESWMKNLESSIPGELLKEVGFSNGSPLLVTSAASLESLHERLNGEKAVHAKFRPNIIVAAPGLEAWDEDYWASLILPGGIHIILTANCARCRSINVDLKTGRMGQGESGKLLKKMMADRRVDKGSKWEPIFGRYGFPTKGGVVAVGDRVEVGVRNEERTTFNGILPRLARFEEHPAPT